LGEAGSGAIWFWAADQLAGWAAGGTLADRLAVFVTLSWIWGQSNWLAVRRGEVNLMKGSECESLVQGAPADSWTLSSLQFVNTVG